MSEQNGENLNSPSPSSTNLDKEDSKDSTHNVSDESSAGINDSKAISRLASFKRPRDLTLSASSAAVPIRHSLGVARTKKTFTPNIPIRREKNKVAEFGSDKAGKPGKRDKKDGGRGRGQGRGRREKEFVQTTGSLFGEGIAASGRRPVSGGFSAGGGGGGIGGGGGGDAGFIHKPVLNMNIANNIDKDHEDKMHKELLRDDFIADGRGFNGDDSDDEFFPVQLPMVDTGKGFKEEDEDKKDAKVPLQQSLNGQDGNVVVKKEPGVEEIDTIESPFKSLSSDTKNLKLGDTKSFRGGIPGSCMNHIAEQSVSQLLQSKDQEIMFIQLPNCLPSHPPSVKQEDNTSKGQQQSQKPSTSSQSTQQQDNEKKTEREFCTLRTLPEGQIGTLKIYKSGRTEMWLGDHKLNVSKGTQVGFLQDVVRIEVNEEEKTGEMSVLGHINHRLICTPDFEDLVKQKFT